MTRIVLIFAIFFSHSSYSQKNNINILPLENDKVVYTEVINAEGLNKDQIFDASKKWIATNYKSSKDIIKFENKETGEITINGSFNLIYNTRDPKIKQTITIQIKNNKYKYTINNFIYSDKQGDVFMIERFPKNWGGKKKVYQKIDAKIKVTIAGLKEKIKTAVSKNDW